MFDTRFEGVARQLYRKYVEQLERETIEKGGLVLSDNNTYTECGIGEHGRIDYSQCPLSEQASIVTWHTHPSRGYKYEPPSGFDLAAALHIGEHFRKDIHGLAIEKEGVWYYRVNFNEKHTSEEHLQKIEWLGNARASQLTSTSKEISEYYHPDDIKEFQLLPVFSTVREYIQKLSNDTNQKVTIQFLQLRNRVPINYSSTTHTKHSSSQT
jgi:hypothetical protein